MLTWAHRFNIFCFLDNQEYQIQPHQYECLLAVGVKKFVQVEDIKQVDPFLKGGDDWVFGHLSYDLKKNTNRAFNKVDRIGFPAVFFFTPRYLLYIKNKELTIIAEEGPELYETILKQTITDDATTEPVSIQQRLDKKAYIEKIETLKAHIHKGDCYEINFCQEFYSENVEINPLVIFQKLMKASPNPFSALYRLNDQYLLCASPERYVTRQGEKILSQPIKGTIRRDIKNKTEDEKLKAKLKASAKDQAENVMVVDLVRNDLSKICEEGTVTVEELFGIYTYPQVHQMISTISGQLKTDTPFSKIIQATFPMGSMTGAPKHRVMELIDKYESQSRGIFSGAVGYYTPQGDFDFNVVIRSIMYNAATKYLSYQVGSGITAYSHPEKEWEECLVKVEAIKKVLGS